MFRSGSNQQADTSSAGGHGRHAGAGVCMQQQDDGGQRSATVARLSRVRQVGGRRGMACRPVLAHTNKNGRPSVPLPLPPAPRRAFGLARDLTRPARKHILIRNCALLARSSSAPLANRLFVPPDSPPLPAYGKWNTRMLRRCQWKADDRS